MSIGSLFAAGMPEQFLLYLVGRVGSPGHQPQTVAHPEDMGIDRHGTLTKGNSEHDIGCLAPYPRQTHQGIHITGHLAAIVLYEHARELYEMARLGIGI